MIEKAPLTSNSLDVLLELFEERWRCGEIPQIEDFLPPPESDGGDFRSRREALLELLMIDLERRWRLAQHRAVGADSPGDTLARDTFSDRPLLEDYVRHFPELGTIDELPLQLIADEYRVRYRWGDQPDHDSYLTRFRHAATLRAALASVDRKLLQSTINFVESSLPRVLGDYTLLTEIARGGMGVVYKARHEKLKRIVAIKLVLSGQLASEQDVERFHAEARAGAHLDHPGIVPIFEVGQQAGQHYLSMSYVEGQSLADMVSSGPLPAQEAAKIVCQVAQAVAYAHGQGVIHRDLKPANILLDLHGRPRVTDFGLAKRVSVSESDGQHGVTATGQILGTPSFMPPEQAAGQLHDVGPESDVYALGAVLYNVIAGRPPFQAANPIDTVLQVLHQEPVAPRKLNPQVPRDLETICLKCLEKDRSRRYVSADALVDDLRDYLDGQPIQARPVGSANRLWRWACRHRAIASLLVVVVVLVAGFAVGMPIAYSMRNALLQQTVVALGKAEAESQRSRRAEREARENFAKYRQEAEEKVAAQSEAIRALEAETEALAEAERERKRAEEQTQRAKTERARASEASRQHALAVQQRERSSYQESIVLAERALREGKVTEAQQLLDESPAPYRSWEWRYLKHLCSTGAQEIRFSGSSFWDIIPHRSAVNDVAVSPQGKLIATAGDDGNLRVFDFARGATELEQKISDEPLRAVAFGLRGRLVAAAGTGHSVHVWDLISKETPVTLPSGKAGTSALAFSKSGLAAGGNDGLVRFWTLPSRKQTVFRGHQRRVKCLFFVHLPATPRFRTGANLLGSVGEDGRLILWRPDGQPAAVFDSPDIDYAVAGFGSGGGLYVATKPDGQISHWRIGLRDNYVPAKVTEPVRVTTRDEKGTARESVRFEATIRPFYAGTAIQLLPGEPLRIPTLGGPFAVTPDRNSLAVCSGFTVTIWDGHSAERRNKFDDYQDVVTGLAWSPDGRQLVTASRDGLVKIRDLTPTSRGHVGPVYSVAFSPGNDRFASAGADRTVKLWDGPKGPLVDSLKHDAAVLSLAFAPDGQHLATGSKDGSVQLWNVSSDRAKSVSRTRTHSGEVRCVAFFPNGKQLASAGRDGTIRSHALDGGSEPIVLLRHNAPINSLAFKPDDGSLAFGSADNKVTLWDSHSGESRTLEGHAGEVVGLASSPSGRRLASAGLDGTIRVWDSLAEIELVRIATKDVSSISFSADGKRLFASTLQENVKILDAETGQVLLTLAAQGPLECLAVSGTEDLLAVGGRNGEIRAWTALAADAAPD